MAFATAWCTPLGGMASGTQWNGTDNLLSFGSLSGPTLVSAAGYCGGRGALLQRESKTSLSLEIARGSAIGVSLLMARCRNASMFGEVYTNVAFKPLPNVRNRED